MTDTAADLAHQRLVMDYPVPILRQPDAHQQTTPIREESATAALQAGAPADGFTEGTT